MYSFVWLQRNFSWYILYLVCLVLNQCSEDLFFLGKDFNIKINQSLEKVNPINIDFNFYLNHHFNSTRNEFLLQDSRFLKCDPPLILILLSPVFTSVQWIREKMGYQNPFGAVNKVMLFFMKVIPYSSSHRRSHLCCKKCRCSFK